MFRSNLSVRSLAGLAMVWALGGAVLPGMAAARAEPATAPPALPAFDVQAKAGAVEAMAKLLINEYVSPDVGAKAAAMLRQNLTAGKYDRIAKRSEFATAVTNDLRDVTHDKHLVLFATDGAPPAESSGPVTPPPPPSMVEFTHADLLKGNIGYIVLNGFPPKGQFAWAADRVVGLLASTDAMIIDLRNNRGGGDEEVPTLLASYFVDGKSPVHIIDILRRKPGTREFDREIQSTENTPVSYLYKSVYLLTGPVTFSAGEAFAYEMQSLNRVTIVGEMSGGGAHPSDFRPVTPGFVVLLPNGSAESPITHGNWEGTGVQPDIAVPVDQAFTVAYAAAAKSVGHEVPPADTPEAVTDAHLLAVSRTTALPGSEAALRRWIDGIIAGQLPDDLFAARASRPDAAFLPVLHADYVGRGALQTLTFANVALGGGDVYEANFADKSRIQLTVYLNEDGKLDYVLDQPY